MLVFDGKYPSLSKGKFLTFVLEYCEESTVRCSVEKPILLNFVNFVSLAQDVLRKHISISNPAQTQ